MAAVKTEQGVQLAPGDGSSWAASDWYWDSVEMTAVARSPQQPALVHAGGCAAAGQLQDECVAALSAAGDSCHKLAAAATLHAADTAPGTSDDVAVVSAPDAKPRGGGRKGGGKAKKGTVVARAVCQADGCGADLSGHTYYHQRNKICALHIKANVFLRDGQQLRFCQRCGHPHTLDEFDPGKHSCRAQLEKHNARRRKRQQEQAGGAAPKPGSNSAARPAAREKAAAGLKRSRLVQHGSPVKAGLPVAPSADAVEAFAVAWEGGLAGLAASWPPAGIQDNESGSADGGSLRQWAASGTPEPRVAAQPAASPSAGPEPSASCSPAVTAVAAAPPAAARPASPPLPLLDFDLDLRPTPYEELFVRPRQLHPADAGLADELATWLDRSLAEDEAAEAAAAQRAAGPQPGARAWAPALGWGAAAAQQPPDSLLLAHGIVQQQALAPLDALLPGCVQQPLLHPHGSGTPPAAGVAPHAPAPPPPTLATVSVKLFGCTPAELPAGLRAHLSTWFDGAVGSMEGYLRPGCVHLTVQALLDGYAAARLGGVSDRGAEADTAAEPGSGAQAAATAAAGAAASAAAAAAPPAAASPAGGGVCCGRKRGVEAAALRQGAPDTAVRRVVERMLSSGETLWRTKTMLVQAGAHVALVHNGRLRQTWDIERASARAVPAVLDVSPPLLLAGQPAPLHVSGINMLQNDCRLLLRLQGRYVRPAAASCDDCACAAAAQFGGSEAEAAASFEQRCCGCCVSKLQLAGLRAAPATPPRLPPPKPAAAPSCCQGQPGPAAPAAPPAELAALEQQPAVEPAAPEQHTTAEPARCCGSAGPPAASSAVRVCAGAAQLQRVRLQLASRQQEVAAEPLLPGLLHLEVQRCAYTAPRGARVLVVASPAVHGELLRVVERQGAAGLPPQLIDQLGVVHEWLGCPHKMQYPLVEATAARLLFWAVGAGLPATGDLLLSVLQAQGGTSGAAAAAVLQRALRPEMAGPAAARALASLDGLSQLHLSTQAAAAAAMQRAAELACHDGLSLLHRAVQSGCGATLRAVLEWGDDAGGGWRCDLAGPQGITPLHLAALLPDAAAARHAVLLLLGRAAPGAVAWEGCCTHDGQSPAAFHRAAAAARGVEGAAAAAALQRDVSVLLAMQQRQQGKPASQPALPPPAALPALRSARPAPEEAAPVGAAVPGAAHGQPARPGSGEAAAAAADMSPSTPRKNPACFCQPGCPCAMLDRCACCSSDSDGEDGVEPGRKPHGGTCGSGSGRCCCCSADAASHLAGCAGCAAGSDDGGAPDGGGSSCCGAGGGAAPRPAVPSCCAK